MTSDEEPLDIFWMRGTKGHFIAFGGVLPYKGTTKSVQSHVWSHLDCKDGKEEDDGEEKEDVIDAMLNRGRGTGKFEGPGLRGDALGVLQDKHTTHFGVVYHILFYTFALPCCLVVPLYNMTCVHHLR